MTSDLSVPAPQRDPSNDEACDHDPGSVAQSAAHRETDKRRLQRPSKVAEGEGSSPSRSTARVDLDLDQIEARANAATEAFNARTANDREWCHEAAVTALDSSADVPALVAEVRRLRGVADAALAELDRSLEARDRRAEAERDAARAEVERLRVEIGRDEPDSMSRAERQEMWKNVYKAERDAAVAEAARLREALQAVRGLRRLGVPLAEFWVRLDAALDSEQQS